MDDLQNIFVQTVSHELRTPLGIIQGYAELLRAGDMGELAPEQQRAISIIVKRAGEMRRLIERIGTLLTITAHTVISTPFDMVEAVALVAEQRRADAQQGGLEYEVKLEHDLPPVAGDVALVEQAVDCLIDNASKFTPAGGRVQVSVYGEVDHVCLSVSDTGIGIAEWEKERVFSPFYQVDSSTTRRYGGIGLGLAVVKAVVEEFGGQVELESKPAQGSRFVLKFPALLSQTEAIAVKKEGVGMQRILVVDDEENVAVTLQASLEVLPDCEIAIALSGDEALRLFERQPFDLLVTDYKMPGMDGITLATRVRQTYPNTTVVMITAYASDVLQETAVQLPIHRILGKPVRLLEIRQVVLEALGRQPIPSANKS